MKRILAILILLVSGSILSLAGPSPGEAYAGNPPDQYLEIIDFKDGLLEDTSGKIDDDDEGDPTTNGDGIEKQANEDLDDGLAPEGLDGLFRIYLMSLTWLLP